MAARPDEPARALRAERLNLRVSIRESALIREAATLVHETVTEFVLDSATERAQRVIDEHTRIGATEQEWAEFWKLLDRPPRSKPRLARLLHQTTVLDRK